MDAAMEAFGAPDAAAGPSAEDAAAARAATAAAAAAAASELGASLGLSDPMLDEGKKEGMAITMLGASRKRPKLTHSLFFEDDRGLKKVLKTFPKIKVRGKGHEYEDVSLLLAHYKKWFQELHPYGDHFEDLVLKTRQVLEDKEKEDDGTISDPRERLHAFRFQYKNSPVEEAPTPSRSGAQLSDDMRARIEANRQKALELKRQRDAQKTGAGVTTATPAAVEELDMDELWRMEEERNAAAKPQRPAFAGFDDEEDDPFGFGGGFDDDQPSAKAPAKAAASAAFDDDEDVFGFGCDFDDAPVAKTTPKPPGASPEATSQKGLDPEVAKRIAENRAKALERKAAAAAAAAAASAVSSSAALRLALQAESSSAAGAAVDGGGAAPEVPAAAISGAAPEEPGTGPGNGSRSEEKAKPSVFDMEDDDFGGGGFDDDFDFGGGGFDEP